MSDASQEINSTSAYTETDVFVLSTGGRASCPSI